MKNATQELNAVVAALRAHEGRYVDDHNSTGELGARRCAAVALHTVFRGNKKVTTVVMMAEGDPNFYPYYCVNNVELAEDGRVHLTRFANGTVRNANGHTIEEHVVEYNREHSPPENGFYHAEISNLTRI